jgi:hypothetical protein
MDACLSATNPLELESLRTTSMQWGRCMPDWEGGYPRKDAYGGIDFWIQWQIKAYKKADMPSKCVNSVPIIIIIYIMEQAYGEVRSEK